MCQDAAVVADTAAGLGSTSKQLQFSGVGAAAIQRGKSQHKAIQNLARATAYDAKDRLERVLQRQCDQSALRADPGFAHRRKPVALGDELEGPEHMTGHGLPASQGLEAQRQ